MRRCHWWALIALMISGCNDDTSSAQPAPWLGDLTIELPATGWDRYVVRLRGEQSELLGERQGSPGERVVLPGLAAGRYVVEVDGCRGDVVSHSRRSEQLLEPETPPWAPSLRAVTRVRPCGQSQDWDPRTLLEVDVADATGASGRWRGDLVGRAVTPFRIEWVDSRGELTLTLPDGEVSGRIDRETDEHTVLVDGAVWSPGQELPDGVEALIPIAAWSYWRLPGRANAANRLLVHATLARMTDALLAPSASIGVFQPPATAEGCEALACQVVTPEAGFGCAQAMSDARLPILPLLDGPPPGCVIEPAEHLVTKQFDAAAEAVLEAECGARWAECPGACGAACGGQCKLMTVYCDPGDARRGAETTPARTCFTVDQFLRVGGVTPDDDYNDCADDVDGAIAVDVARACNANECCFQHDECSRKDRGYFDIRDNFAYAAGDLVTTRLVRTPPTAVGACHLLGAMACSADGLRYQDDQWGRSYGRLDVDAYAWGDLLFDGVLAVHGTPAAGWTIKWFDRCGEPLERSAGGRAGYHRDTEAERANEIVDFGTCRWTSPCAGCAPELIEHTTAVADEPIECLVHDCLHGGDCPSTGGAIVPLDPVDRGVLPEEVVFSWQIDSSSDAFGYQLQVATEAQFSAGNIVADESIVDAAVRTQPAGRSVVLPSVEPGQQLYWRVRGAFPVWETLDIVDQPVVDPVLANWAIDVGVCDVVSEVVELLLELVARQTLRRVPFIGRLLAYFGANTIEAVVEALDERCPPGAQLIHNYGEWSRVAQFTWGGEPGGPSPCAGLVNGWYCGDNGPTGYEGDPDDLIFCRDGRIDHGRTRHCPDGCRRNPQDDNDECEGAVAPPVDGAPALTYPLPTRRATTDTPAGHNARNVRDRNWDIDCVRYEPVGAVVSGRVSRLRNDAGNGLVSSYGNHVCIIDEGTGLEVCQNHLETGSVVVAQDCFVRAGENIGDCGISGSVIPVGNGDGSHVDVYAHSPDGTPFELPPPDAWPLGAALGEATCEPPTRPCEIPTLATPPEGAEVDPDEVQFRWSDAECPPDPAESYRIQVNDEAFPAACVGDQDLCAVVYNETTRSPGRQVSELAPCTTYRWRVRAGHSGNDERAPAASDFSDAWTFRTTGCDDPGPEPDCRDGQSRDCYRGPQGTENIGRCRGGSELCVGGAWGGCTGQRIPLNPDACNNVDDDCDGRTDEEPGCNAGTVCQAGRCVANCVPEAESCNGRNDDCDGAVDEDATCPAGQVCRNGACACAPQPETCNGQNDDCDGAIDEEAPCPAGQTCRNGACACAPQPEACNGQNDDCDGAIDEDAPCPAGQVCRNGGCACAPQPEVCNGQNDDCDGAIDEDAPCPAGRSCQGGACVQDRDSYLVDGCNGGAYDARCTSNCEGCQAQNGFVGYNEAGCGGATCFQRYPNHGEGGFVFMFVRRAQTAHMRWSFDAPLQGHYLIEAFVPSTADLAEPFCGGWSVSNAVGYNLKSGDETTRTVQIDQASRRGNWVTLFDRDVTGTTSITVGNSWPANPGCGQILGDAIRATPR